MGRTQNEIKAAMTTSFMANQTLANTYGFNVDDLFNDHFSSVSIENILFDIVSYAIFLFEKIFTQHKQTVNIDLLNQKNARLPWYRTMALRFQYGFDLIPDTDNFDNTAATEAQIEASKIVKYSAVTEAEIPATIILKIAGETADELAPLSIPQRESFEAYVEEFKPAGIEVRVINYLPDLLYLNLQIQRDPLVLDANGMSIINGNFPVNDAIQAYMKELPFNGELVVFDLLKFIELNAEGVITPTALNVESAWIDPLANDYGEPVSIPIKKIAESGYYKVDNFDNIEYVV